MSLGQIFLTALLYTLIGMGTVFCVLIFISICIWLLGKAFAPRKPAVQAAAAVKDEEGVPEEGYIVRNVRRATWRHTS